MNDAEMFFQRIVGPPRWKREQEIKKRLDTEIGVDVGGETNLLPVEEGAESKTTAGQEQLRLVM